MSDPLAGLIDAARRRRETWSHEIVTALPLIEEIKESAIIGSYSVILEGSRRRLLLKSACIELAPGILETPSTIARDYLKQKYGQASRITGAQLESVAGGLYPMPLLAIPCDFDYGFYIDIKSAYWSIMLAAGWDVDYFPGRWLSRGTPPDDFPFPDHKIARNCLVSAGLAGSIQRYDPVKGFSEYKTGSRLVNKQLYRLISDTLNYIAAGARDAGAIYANTDGFIVTSADSLARVADLIGQWGLSARIKSEGAGAVIGPGDYRVGKMKSRRGLTRPLPIHNIFVHDYCAWLRERLARLAALASAPPARQRRTRPAPTIANNP